MSKKTYQLLNALRYFLTSKHKKGFGIHSPFLFNLITKCFNKKLKYGKYYKAVNFYKQLLKDDTKFIYCPYGTNKTETTETKISRITKGSSVGLKYSRLLYNISEYFASEETLEFGTSLGVSTAFLSAGSKKVTTVEGCPNTVAIAKSYHEKFDINNICYINTTIEDYLESDEFKRSSPNIIFIDASHTYNSIITFFYKLLKVINNNSIIIFDDIYWSFEMNKAWKKIISEDSVTQTVDLLRFGIVFFDKRLNKENFTIRY